MARQRRRRPALYRGAPLTTVAIDGGGAHGSISARVADIDSSKQVSMVTRSRRLADLALGWDAGGGQNQWHWAGLRLR